MILERLLKVIVSPHVTNKVCFNDKSCAVFKVLANANKYEIKKDVEVCFGVKVDFVKVLNVKGKQRRFKNVIGKTKSFKKAYVKLKSDYNINFVDAN